MKKPTLIISAAALTLFGLVGCVGNDSAGTATVPIVESNTVPEYTEQGAFEHQDGYGNTSVCIWLRASTGSAVALDCYQVENANAE